MTAAELLVVDDDAEMSQLLARLLEAEGYGVHVASDRRQIAEALSERPFDLMLLDLMLGGDDGREVLRDLRREGDLPVVILTGCSLEMERIVGLKMGADDYVVKPFSPGELLARIESVLRRTRNRARQSAPTAPQLVFGELCIDSVTREVQIGGKVVEFTAKEFDLLAFLAASPRQVFTRQQLLDRVWSSTAEWQTEATFTEHVRRIRRKIEADPDRPEWIVTVRGVGYRFERASRTNPTPGTLVLAHSA
jgi:two-component system, OmpR family, phosphate regulon response regulator PhoB